VAAVTARAPVLVTIDRLVLHGIDRADAAAVQRALAAQLRSALAAAGSGFPASAALPDVRLAAPSSNDPAALGHSAGAGIAAALVPARRQSG
jgi:hypothetical protein